MITGLMTADALKRWKYFRDILEIVTCVTNDR